ncbi:phosphoribosylanthranilate isomerase [Kaistella sp. 97-N-M2]|uniref:phosphoribosylanthranilate isomerase n=1 Tax=Kaistella sp. 97-N-M2 TaxID=2908645 RepID=UPI001F1C9D3D|nr:phosphoribosylanthranilate isomerase [Kaistella sp. 97-N-M2]UJF29932.1 phosphoribosylanthranilate isomerase [Kaistella sp. 97-N-M2]
MKLKVCGLTNLPQIQELASSKVHFLGFIFYEKSPRYVLNSLNLEEIRAIQHEGKVGVFVNESLENIIHISEKANLDFIQLHGDEDENFISALRKKLVPQVQIIKVIRIGQPSADELQKIIDNQPSAVNYLLFDTDSKSFGGTGNSFEWNILNELKIEKPFFLSGGISLENIHQLSKINTQPFALDINSKFETEPGTKDLLKIKKFKSLLLKED